MKRQERSLWNQSKFWRQKRQRMQVPADRAHLEYEVIRKQIKAITDLSDQAAAWKRLEAVLAEFGRQLGGDLP